MLCIEFHDLAKINRKLNNVMDSSLRSISPGRDYHMPHVTPDRHEASTREIKVPKCMPSGMVIHKVKVSHWKLSNK